MDNSYALTEIQSKYQNCNLLIPAATSVQINPFYKCTVMEVVADTSENSGDIFKVGNISAIGVVYEIFYRKNQGCFVKIRRK